MPGVLKGDRIVVADEAEASTLHNKGRYGTPRSGGGLELDLVEALFLVELGRLEVQDADLADLLVVGVERRERFEIRYLVYRDLRDRGFVVTVDDGFRIFPRGKTPNQSPPKARVVPKGEREPFDPAALAKRRDATGTPLLVALVDEEGDLTYYRVEDPDLDASDPAAAPDVDGEALLLTDRAVVLDPGLSRRLQDAAFLGRLVDDRLQLSLVETAHLHRQGLTVRTPSGNALDGEALADRAERVQPDFDLRLTVYEALRDRGLRVKTGFKYGCHFRVYRVPPDEGHAEILVHALPPGFEGAWPEVSGFVRLAHSVRKTMVFVTPTPDGPASLALVRARP